MLKSGILNPQINSLLSRVHLGTPPAAPTGLAATAGNVTIALSWNAAATASQRAQHGLDQHSRFD